jgi:hypothetical protein
MLLNHLHWLCSLHIIFGSVDSISRHHMKYLHLSECTIANTRSWPLSLFAPSISAPLLSNILPHLQTLLNFVTNTLPKPVLFALLYRLSVMQLASYILPTIGADSWETEQGVDDGWEGRPVCRLPYPYQFYIDEHD